MQCALRSRKRVSHPLEEISALRPLLSGSESFSANALPAGGLASRLDWSTDCAQNSLFPRLRLNSSLSVGCGRPDRLSADMAKTKWSPSTFGDSRVLLLELRCARKRQAARYEFRLGTDAIRSTRANLNHESGFANHGLTI